MAIPNELYNVKFAEWSESIQILYLVDDKFKKICDDYCAAKTDTIKFEKRLASNFDKKTKSKNLEKELEEEILFYLIRKT
ncbi:hypothetical protein [Flavobacterium phragmitis]|uniref:Uncharacterized protein n=1 Tax=Flavobacterium phragmitis TaxID=739143 RepID=A0A1I1M1L1_9FLAO|nr:hypothetical protein [Flavobacterium phragmitis]SFC75550.1 hypothetical protein SAMN05216297_102162 [Flavobacterium phragmitis]